MATDGTSNVIQPAQIGGAVRFDRTVNLGHIITATTFLAAAIMAWATLSAKVESQDQVILKNEAAIDGKLQAVQRELSRVENMLVRDIAAAEKRWQDTRTEDRATLGRIEAKLERALDKLDMKQDKVTR